MKSAAPIRRSGLWIDFLIVWFVLLVPIYPTTALYWGGARGSDRTYQCLGYVLLNEVRPLTDVAYTRPLSFILIYPPVLIAAIAANHLIARRRAKRAGP